MDIHILFRTQLLLCERESVSIFICTSARDSSAQFAQGNRAETVICSAVVTNSSSRFNSFTTFSSQQSATSLIVDLLDVWELCLWPDSRACACAPLVCVCVCLCVKCGTLLLASGV